MARLTIRVEGIEELRAELRELYEKLDLLIEKEMPEYFTAEQVARIEHISVETVRHHVREGGRRCARRIGKKILFNAE